MASCGDVWSRCMAVLVGGHCGGGLLAVMIYEQSLLWLVRLMIIDDDHRGDANVW